MSLDQKVDKRIGVIGVSDEEAAHLRLLMRKAADELHHRWQWGNESAADLLVVDPSSFAGQMARTRAIAGGMRCAIFSDESVSDSDLVLRRPLKLANVIAVLNEAGDMTTRPEGIVAQQQDFYFGEVDNADAAFDDEETPRPRGPSPDTAPGLEELLRVDPADVRDAARVKTTLDENTTVFGTGGPTARSEARGREAHDVFTRVRPDAVPETVLARGSGAPDTSRHDLRAFLDSDILGGPARTALPHAPALTLDPKNKAYHSTGRLVELEPYCRAPLRTTDWQRLTSAELAELRQAEPPQPYARLVWLCVLLHSGGKLAPHLDPGGTYRLTRWLEIERDFSSYFRIASTMLQAARLHEIAAASSAKMSDVFDVVNAFDAIGLIEWQPRAPRGGGEPVEEPKKGLMQRLKKSLKRT